MSQEGRVYLYQCSFAEKDAAKRAGARWDGEEKKWYVPEDRFVLMEMFNPWRPKGRIYLNCPFSDKERVKKMGAKWDMQVKKWYIFPSTSISENDFAEWLPSFHPANNWNEDLNEAKQQPERMEDETTRDGAEEMKQYDESGTQEFELTQLAVEDSQDPFGNLTHTPINPLTIPWGRLIPHSKYQEQQQYDLLPRKLISNVGSATRSRSSDASSSNHSLSPNNFGATRGIDFLGLVNIQSYDRFNQYTIGRSKNCDIVATKRRKESEETKWVHTLISNTHCRIFCLLSNIRHHHATSTFTADGMEVYIEDSSGNGTVINNSILLKKNERRILHTGDTICLINPKILQKKLRNANLEQEIMQHYSFVFINMYQTQDSCGALGSMDITATSIKNIPSSGIKSSVVVKTPNEQANNISTTYTPTSSGRKRGLVDVKATKTKSIFQQCVTSVDNRKNTSNENDALDTKRQETADDATKMPPPEKKIKSIHNHVSGKTIRTIESEYDLRDEIGSGVCGIVRRAIDRKTGKMVAVKEIAINQGGRNRTVNLNALNNDLDPAIRAEATMLQSIDHPYIVKLIDVFVHPGKAVYLVMELLNGGDLFDRIVEKGRYTETESRQVMRRIMAAVYYLHQERDIVHRDLKPENILLASRSNDIIVKITDFGLAKSITDDGLKTFCGTPQYFAPEVLRRRHTVAGHGRYGKEADMWSMGVILYILLSGTPPFDASIGTDEIDNIEISFTGSRWEGISDGAKDLILKLLSKDPVKRISVANACSHPWILTPDGDTHVHPLEDPNVPRTPVKPLRNEMDKCTEVDSKDDKLNTSALHVSPTPPKISHTSMIDGNTKQTKLSSWLAKK